MDNPLPQELQEISAQKRPIDDELVDWLSGACLLVRMEAFREVGGFDDSYFMFFEDTQLGEQFKAAGWQSVYLPLAKIYHEQVLAGRTDQPPCSVLITAVFPSF